MKPNLQFKEFCALVNNVKYWINLSTSLVYFNSSMFSFTYYIIEYFNIFFLSLVTLFSS
jgi:hypothetical protein